MTLTIVPPRTIVEALSMIDERLSPRKSDETSGSSLTPRMPAIGPSAAALSDPMFDVRGGAFTLGLGLEAGVAIIPESEKWSEEALGRTRSLATTPVEELLALPMLQLDRVKDSLHAYQLSKRGNSLRVMAEAVRWGRRGARINTISPGIIITPLANDELRGPRGAGRTGGAVGHGL